MTPTKPEGRKRQARPIAEHADIEPHLRTETEKRELHPRLARLGDELVMTQGLILKLLKEVGLTVVPLDPRARDVAPARKARGSR